MLRGTVPSNISRGSFSFSHAPQANINRSKFDRSFGVKTSFLEGYLVPILCDEMVPGDTFSLNMHAFARVGTLSFPIMDNMYMETFFFFIPNRLLWTNWEKFCGYQVNPGDSTDFTVPQITCPAMAGVATGDLMDYMGVPTMVPNLTPNAWWTRAYNFVYNEWFRDQNLQNSVTFDVGNGPDTYTNYVLLRRGKRRDYFTSCLPFPQKGPDVLLPLGSKAPIVSNATPDAYGRTPVVFGSTMDATAQTGVHQAAGALSGTNVSLATGDWTWPLLSDVNYNYADLANATAADINDIRYAFQLQKFYERQARGGSRYTEVIKSFFNVISPDMRLQRPEYIGGSVSPVIVNPVAQTQQPTSSTQSNALGNLGAYGVCAPDGHGFTYSATEHGIILGLVQVRADLNYQQGLERQWSRQVFTDFYWPVFSQLGEQAVLNQEIYAQGNSQDTEVFGYQERYAEYRYKPSIVTGLFRSNATGSLDAWHLAQDFSSLPVLNSSFIVENAPMTRVLVAGESRTYDFIFDAVFRYHCARPIPVHGVPGYVDHH